MVTRSISRNLAKFISNLSYAELPAEVICRAKNLILDALSCVIIGSGFTYPRIALELVKDNKGNATIFAHDLQVPAMDAAFVNAIQINSAGQDDMINMSHPGSVIVSSALAIAEQENSSGAEVITAVVAGYELLERIFLGAPKIVPRFRGTPMFGPFGSAAAAGKLLKLSEDELTNALGYAANLSSGFAECWIAGTMEGKFHTGIAARNGIMAAKLAKAGATAAEKTLEGESGFYQAFAGTTDMIDAAVNNLGKRFFIMDATIKSYPVCGLQQIPVDLALTLARQQDIIGKDIDNITEKMPESDFSYPGTNYTGPFTTRFQAIMSAQFCAAAAFLGKPVTSPSFFDNSYDDPEVADLAGKVELIGEKKRNKIMIEVTLRDGRQYSIEGGRVEMLLPTTDKIKVKFQNLASDILGKQKAEEVMNTVLELEKVENVRQITHMLGKISK